MTTIDEAKATLHRHAEWLEHLARNGYPTEAERARLPAIRTLLSSYDEMKGRIEEAVRIMKPFAEANNLFEPCSSDGVGRQHFMAAKAFVSREKVDGGAR